MNPQTILYLEEGASVTLETIQIKGVDDTKRYTKAVLGKDAEIIIQEKLLTHGQQHAVSEMDVFLNEAGSKTRVISRSVAQDDSSQIFYPRVEGNAPCFGHVQCDAIIMGSAKVRAIPEITCNHVDASLIHEAAIGKIAWRADCQAHDPGPHSGGSRGADSRGLFALKRPPAANISAPNTSVGGVFRNVPPRN